MAKILCVLYDDPVTGYPKKLIRDEIPVLEKYPLPIRFDTEYIKNQVEIIEGSGSDYVESATPLSSWISTIMQDTSKDILGLEQTVKLGDIGGITLLTFQD